MRKSKQPILHYDAEADALALYWRRGAEEEFIEFAPNIFIEFNKKGKMIGLEILRASKILRPALKSLVQKGLARTRA